jgi:hypothetical protein
LNAVAAVLADPSAERLATDAEVASHGHVAGRVNRDAQTAIRTPRELGR